MKKWTLVVHGDLNLLDRLVGLFNQEEDFICHGVSDGEAAIDLLRTNPEDFNLVIAAMRVPNEGDGLRLLEAIKTDEALRHLPVLMIVPTFFTNQEISDVGRLGAFAWSNNPFETETLFFVIRTELALIAAQK